jgi:hypothetical protein
MADPMSDPLQAAANFCYSGSFFPYGFPVYLRSNNSDVIAAARESWGPFSGRFESKPLELRVLVSGDGAACGKSVPLYRAQRNLLTAIADANNWAVCDLASGFGSLNLSTEVVEDSEFFRFHFLEGIVYTLLNACHILTIHAGCVAWKGTGVVLAGQSGAGKSSFAYACARRGWTYVADDASSIPFSLSTRTVLGNPQTVRFRPSALKLFPELQGCVKLRNGKPTIEIKTEQFENFASAEQCDVSRLIFLNRDASACKPALSVVSRIESRRRIYQSPLPAELPIHRHRKEALERLLDAQCYELSYSNFDEAITLLEHTVEQD